MRLEPFVYTGDTSVVVVVKTVLDTVLSVDGVGVVVI